jgi:hypothetical protein
MTSAVSKRQPGSEIPKGTTVPATFTPLEVGELVCLEHSEHRIVDVVPSPSRSAVYALVKVRPAHLRPFVRAQ